SSWYLTIPLSSFSLSFFLLDLLSSTVLPVVRVKLQIWQNVFLLSHVFRRNLDFEYSFSGKSAGEVLSLSLSHSNRQSLYLESEKGPQPNRILPFWVFSLNSLDREP